MTDRAKEYFDQLQKAIDEERNSDIIDISTQILNFMPGDHELLLCRGVANLMEGEYEEAYNDIKGLKGCEFEKSYCLYKLERFQEAIEIYNKVSNDMKNEERFIHLAAQILFRLDKGDEVLKLYEKLPKDDENTDILVNISAACAISHHSDIALSKVTDDAETEQIYNTTIALIEDGQKEKAIEFVERGYAMVEKKDSLLGQLFDILRSIIPSIPAGSDFDPAKVLLALAENESANKYARAIAACDYVAINPEDRANHKKYRQLYSDFSSQGVRKTETEGIILNQFVLAHNFGETKKAQGLVSEAAKNKDFDPLLAESLARTVDPSKASSSQYSSLFNAQAKIQEGNYAEAANILQSSPFAKEPRTITVVSELYAAAKDVDGALAYLKKNESDNAEYLEFACRFALKHGKAQEASKWANNLTKVTSNAPWAVALLAMSYATIDLEMAERYANRLKSQTISDADADKLESTTLVDKLTSRNEAAEAATAFDKVVGKAKPKRDLENMSEEKRRAIKEKHRRRRRLQLPRNYDPNRKPDPERWTRKSQRAANRGRRKTKAPVAKTAGLGGKVIEAPKQPQKKKGGKKHRW